jgi:hypothetical protein
VEGPIIAESMSAGVSAGQHARNQQLMATNSKFKKNAKRSFSGYEAPAMTRTPVMLANRTAKLEGEPSAFKPAFMRMRHIARYTKLRGGAA